MMKTRRGGMRTIAPVLFWGALWGLAEAVLGHGLHLVRIPGLAGWIMFPLGFWMMRRAFLRTGRTVLLAAVPAVAAAVKLADFLLPVPDPFLVLNPAAAILMEGAAVAWLLVKVGEQRPSLASLAAVSAAWRAAYLVWGTAAASLAGAPNAFALASFAPWRFFALDPLLAALAIHAAFGVARARGAGAIRVVPAGALDGLAARPSAAIALAFLAAAFELLLTRS